MMKSSYGEFLTAVNRLTSVELSDLDPPAAATALLGATLTVRGVTARIVETEAYGSDPAGPWPDPAAHSYPGPTQRNSVMFGRAGVLYVYLSYGMHHCCNVTIGPVGSAGAVLLRAAEIVSGHDVVGPRRPTARTPADLARGPGNLGAALAITLADNGADLLDPKSDVRLDLSPQPGWLAGPRVGISTAADVAWRYWLPGSPAVSVYRRSPRAERSRP